MYLNPARNRHLAEKLFRHVRGGTTDQCDDFFEYDLAIYKDPDIAERERAAIFERLPMMALHSSQLTNSDDYITVQLNRSQALVTRGKDGKVRAFLNVCRHRGATLVRETSGKQARFACPYHGWTYQNDGTLLGISFKDTTGLETPCPSRNLIALPTEERHGFIWIVENPAGTINVAQHLGPDMDEILGDYHLEKHFCIREQIFDFGQNWKVMVDGLIDGYHVSFVHGPTIKPYFHLNLMALADVQSDHCLTTTPRRKIEEILHETPGDTPIDDYVVFGNLIMPNNSMQLHPHHVEFWTMYQNPEDPTRSRVHLRFLTPKKYADYDERGQRIIEKNWEIASAAILNEDVPIGDSIQNSARMPHIGKMLL